MLRGTAVGITPLSQGSDASLGAHSDIFLALQNKEAPFGASFKQYYIRVLALDLVSHVLDDVLGCVSAS